MEVDLSGLRDIHMPIEPSWWPPALGWWLVLAGIFVVALIFGLIYGCWYNRPKQYALRELKHIYVKEKNSVEMARQVSLLLKRVALFNYPRKKVAALTDEQWIAFLQSKTAKSFSVEQLELLAISAYMPDELLTPLSTEGLYKAATKGIKQLFKGEKHGSRKKSA